MPVHTALLVLFAAQTADAQEVGAVLSSQLAVDVADDRPGEDHTEVHSRFRMWTRGETKKDGSWFIEARAEHHLLAGDDLEGWWEPSLGETGWEGRLTGPLRLAVGNRIERWGKLDLLPVADVLNPRDLRNGPMTPQEWQRLPIPMATMQVGSDPTKNVSVRSETTWIPFASADKVWLRGTDWSYIRNGMTEQEAQRLGDVSDIPRGEPTLLPDLIRAGGEQAGNLDPSMRRSLDNVVASKNMPQALFYNSEIAQRFELQAPGFDVAVMGAYLRNRQQQTELDPALADILRTGTLPSSAELLGGSLSSSLEGGPLKTTWPRTGFFGAEASTLVGPIGVRAEGGYWTHKTARLFYGGATTTPEVSAGLGLDYVRGSDLQISVEARYQARIDAPDELLLIAPQDLQIAGGGRYSFAQDRFRLQLGGSYSVHFSEWLFMPSFEWRPTSHVRVELGAVLIDGPWEAPPALPRAYIYEGGPASYFSQNDVVTVRFSWVW